MRFGILPTGPPTFQTLTTNVTSGLGSVSPNCSSGCSEAVSSSISLSAIPSPGYAFSSWSVTGASCSGGLSSNPCTFSMPNNAVTGSVTFVSAALPLTVVGPITPPSTPSGGTTSTSAVKLEAQVLSNGAAISSAAVSVFVDGVKKCAGTSSGAGYFTCGYTATHATHSWYATASKSGYSSASSPTWTFTYNPSATTYAVTASVKFASTCRSVSVTVNLTSGSTIIATNTLSLSCSKLSGSVQFSMLNAGTYTVTITGSGVITQSKTTTIPPNETLSFSI